MMKVALCMKENLFREAMEKLLSSEGSYDVVASAGKVSTCVSASRVHDARAIVVVWDGLDAEDLEFLKNIKEQTSALLLVIADTAEEVTKAGVSAERFVPKHGTHQRLYRQLNELATKEMRPKAVVRERVSRYGTAASLTPREHEIALKVAEGLSNRDIAYDLDLAEQTVKNLVSVIMRKMGCTNRVQVALKLSKPKGDYANQ
ncbi:MAG: response regulator transcription factor [Armatimonadetes bacterium]|nr:response regulator transcription factor [Armatimonadota bacterium]